MHCSKKITRQSHVNLESTQKVSASAMGLRDFDLQSQPTLMGGEPINCRAVQHYIVRCREKY